MGRIFRRFGADVSAGVAVEYGILLPTFMAMLLGSIWTGNLLFAQNGLVRAVQFGARCAAVKTTVCTNPRLRFERIFRPLDRARLHLLGDRLRTHRRGDCNLQPQHHSRRAERAAEGHRLLPLT
jgi:hypothetical protein